MNKGNFKGEFIWGILIRIASENILIKKSARLFLKSC